MQNYGLPVRNYVDNLRVFRFAQHRDSVHVTQDRQTDDAEPRWCQVLRSLGVQVIYSAKRQVPLVPDFPNPLVEAPMWSQGKLVHSVRVPMPLAQRVHFSSWANRTAMPVT